MKRQSFLSKLLPLLLPLLFLAGCETVQNRIDDNYPYFMSLSPSHREIIRQGRIGIGFTPDEVYLAWGSPSHRIFSQSSRGRGEKWVYTSIGRDTYYRRIRRYNSVSSKWYYDEEPVYIRREYIVKDVLFIDGRVDAWTLYPADILY